MLVLVEGASDAEAVRALAGLIGCDLDAGGIELRPAAGITNFPQVLGDYLQRHPGATVCGLYDAADAHHVRRAVERARQRDATPAGAMHFFCCEADLEDELIRAAGTPAVLEVLQAEGELASFRRFQSMPAHRERALPAQLHRFLGTRATRKIRCARRITERLSPAALPPPFARLAERLLLEAGRPLRHDRPMQHPPLAAWHRLVRERDPDALDALLADDAVFLSPIVHAPQRGKALTRLYLRAAFQVFFNDSFRYVRELCDGRDAVLEFETTIDGVMVNGVDMIHFDEAGRIAEFKVMLRPLKAIQLIHERMGRMLQSMQRPG